MSSRFEDVPRWAYDLVNGVKKDVFPELANAAIKVLYDTKKRKSGGSYVLGKVQKSNEIIKILTEDDIESPEGVDYVMYLDKSCFESVEEPDRVRLIRRFLRFCDVDLESDNPYKLKHFEVEDWYEEIQYNSDDPRWFERCLTVTESIYDSED